MNHAFSETAVNFYMWIFPEKCILQKTPIFSYEITKYFTIVNYNKPLTQNAWADSPEMSAQSHKPRETPKAILNTEKAA
jgi:hypothetical protein